MLKTLLDIAKIPAGVADSNDQYALLGLDHFVNKDSMIADGLHAGKQVFNARGALTAKGFSQISRNSSVIVLVHSTAKDNVFENKDIVTIQSGEIICILDGYWLIRKYGNHCDLEAMNLQGAQLEGANLENSNLADANLAGANLKNSILKGANLTGTDFQQASLVRCNLQKATLEYSDFRRTNLTEADLRHAFLNKVAFRGAEFWSAYIWDIDLTTCFTEGTDLSRADARGVKRAEVQAELAAKGGS